MTGRVTNTLPPFGWRGRVVNLAQTPKDDTSTSNEGTFGSDFRQNKDHKDPKLVAAMPDMPIDGPSAAIAADEGGQHKFTGRFNYFTDNGPYKPARNLAPNFGTTGGADLETPSQRVGRHSDPQGQKETALGAVQVHPTFDKEMDVEPGMDEFDPSILDGPQDEEDDFVVDPSMMGQDPSMTGDQSMQDPSMMGGDPSMSGDPSAMEDPMGGLGDEGSDPMENPSLGGDQMPAESDDEPAEGDESTDLGDDDATGDSEVPPESSENDQSGGKMEFEDKFNRALAKARYHAILSLADENLTPGGFPREEGDKTKYGRAPRHPGDTGKSARPYKGAEWGRPSRANVFPGGGHDYEKMKNRPKE